MQGLTIPEIHGRQTMNVVQPRRQYHRHLHASDSNRHEVDEEFSVPSPSMWASPGPGASLPINQQLRDSPFSTESLSGVRKRYLVTRTADGLAPDGSNQRKTIVDLQHRIRAILLDLAAESREQRTNRLLLPSQARSSMSRRGIASLHEVPALRASNKLFHFGVQVSCTSYCTYWRTVGCTVSTGINRRHRPNRPFRQTKITDQPAWSKRFQKTFFQAKKTKATCQNAYSYRFGRSKKNLRPLDL